MATPQRSDTPLSPTPVKDALTRAAQGGIAGATAMSLQVLTLMWLRTTMNYQYRYGTTTTVALRTLWKEGGVVRLYRGLGPALAQGPLSRFGDTAANTGVLAYLNSREYTRDLPVGVKTACASASSASFRVMLMPLDTLKTIMQVEGKPGVQLLGQKVRQSGPRVLFHGTLATFAGNLAGHFPWFFTYNLLDAHLPPVDTLTFPERLLRSATMGFASSVVSDSISNSIRVIKTTKQTSQTAVSYKEAIKMVVDKDGVLGLMGRGLKTRIITNGIQGLMFSVMWRLIDDKFFKKQ
eukprot:TRINITY_DN2032_c0_g3_i1.p1 TRINITY_DN2032_c0_g3~~TRINITY_DN2032_c0_g3_i1.p1  ORF type:complete len:294 (+),score=52.49 TRINITY_DN2032_c0_g3_i1:44-925(+)